MLSESLHWKKTSIGAEENKRQAATVFSVASVFSVVKNLTWTLTLTLPFTFTNRSVGSAILQHGDRSSIIKARVGS